MEVAATNGARSSSEKLPISGWLAKKPSRPRASASIASLASEK